MANDIVIGAKQIPNPKGIKVSSDTDRPKSTPPKMPGGAKMDTSNPYGRSTDISNPPKNQMEPKQHEIDELFQKPCGIRHPLGRCIPKADVTVSDN